MDSKISGQMGGRARSAKLTALRRKEIASNAAKKRWNKPFLGVSINADVTSKTLCKYVWKEIDPCKSPAIRDGWCKYHHPDYKY